MTAPNGVWTYRSFANFAPITGDFNRIAIWEAELMLQEIAGSNAFYGHIGTRVDPVPENHPYLTVKGRSYSGDPRRVTFRALGVPGTAFDGWIYDYDGYISPVWLNGIEQVPTITGTVIRTAPHGTAPAGEVFSFYAVKQPFTEARSIASQDPDRPRISLPDSVLDMLASERHRLHHQIWHASRNSWPRLTAARRTRLRDLNWQPGPKDAERQATASDRLTNGSGEDFLYMHRRMVEMVRADFDFSPWRRLPAPGLPSSFAPGFPADRVGNPDGFAIPDAWEIPGAGDFNLTFAFRKTREGFHSEFQRAEARFTNPDYLARISLGELGARLEFTIHNWMHMRWASLQRDPETGAAMPGGRDPLDFDPKWFRPENDDLADTFSSHVHPVFWRLHGWIDDRVTQWAAAQEEARPGTVLPKDVDGVPWFEADGTWVQIAQPWEGPLAASSAHGSGDHDGHGNAGSGHHGHLDLDPEVIKEALLVIYGPEPDPTAEDVDATAPKSADTIAAAAAPWPNWFALELTEDLD